MIAPYLGELESLVARLIGDNLGELLQLHFLAFLVGSVFLCALVLTTIANRESLQSTNTTLLLLCVHDDALSRLLMKRVLL